MSSESKMRRLFELEGKVALITGASKGIGEAIARGMAEFGASVIVSSRNAQAVGEVAQAFRADGLEATAIAANMGRMEDIEHLVDQSVAAYGGLDIIVNNAATNPVYGPIQKTDERAFAKALPAFLDHMKSDGRIESWRMMRCKLGLRPDDVREFHIMIETRDLAQLDTAFRAAAARSGTVPCRVVRDLTGKRDDGAGERQAAIRRAEPAGRRNRARGARAPAHLAPAPRRAGC